MHLRPVLALWLTALLAPAALGDDRSTAEAHWAAQRWAEAAAAYERVVAATPNDSTAWFRLGYAWHSAGDYDKALPAHLKAAEFADQQPLASYNAACALARLNRKDEAFAQLKVAVARGFADKATLAQDADFASLRDDPRFAEIQASVGARPASQPADARGTGIYREFDFWVGEWEVHNPQGQKVGENRIESRENGHLIVENWTDIGGKTGTSINYVDLRDKQWKQVWVSQGGWLVHTSGGFSDGAMRMVGDSNFPNGRSSKTRSTFTPLPDGRVRQLIETSPDGENWTVGFDGLYSRKPAARPE